MAPRKNFPLRLDPAVHDALAAWAADEFRSVNGHIEWVLREGLKRAGRKVVPRSSELPELPFDDAAPEATGEVAANAATRGPTDAAGDVVADALGDPGDRDAAEPEPQGEPQADGA